MRRDRARRLVGLLGAPLVLLALLLLVPSGASASGLTTTKCAAGSPSRLHCGRVVVPLDRGGASRATVSLAVQVLDPSSGPVDGTVIALAGGPGQAATPLTSSIAETLGSVLDHRRLVTFDQRGTGGSGRLTCSAIERSDSSAAIAACARQLGARRTDYTTAASVADLDAVRAAVGADSVILMGTSYGTKVALAYAAAQPAHVAKLVLDSAVLPSGIDPFDRTTIASIPRVLRTVCANGGCPFTRSVVSDLGALMKRLATGSLHGTWYDGAGRAHNAAIGGGDVLELLLDSDVDPFERADLPAAIHAGLSGDAAPLLRLAAGASSSEEEDAQDSDALFLATTCEDGGVPWPSGTPVARRAAATNAELKAIPASAFGPFGAGLVRSLGEIDLCRGWPDSPIAQPSAALPATPTLILSGDEDLRTPRFDALELAGELPDATVVEVPGTGHSVLGSELGTDCAAVALRHFLAGDRVAACSQPRRPAVPATQLPPRSLAALTTVHGFSARAGRTLHAFVLTYRDLETRLSAALTEGGATLAVGGLRGGDLRSSKGALVLTRYSYVPGVTVSGRFTAHATTVAFTLGGSAGASGTIRLNLRTRSVSGTLDGRRFALGPQATAALGDDAVASAAAITAVAARAPQAVAASAEPGPRLTHGLVPR